MNFRGFPYSRQCPVQSELLINILKSYKELLCGVKIKKMIMTAIHAIKGAKRDYGVGE